MSDDFDKMSSFISQIQLSAGDEVIVHSSLNAIGGQLAWAPGIINHLLSLIEDAGTLLMPAYPFDGSAKDYIATDPLFDPQKSPTFMGALPFVFLRQFPVCRSLHPWASIAALGANAEHYVCDHHLDTEPFGKRSPYYKLAERHGKILLLGVGYTRNSSFNIVESLHRELYHEKIYQDKLATMRYRDQAGSVKSMQTLAPERIRKPDYNSFGTYLETRSNFCIWSSTYMGITTRLLDAHGFLEANVLAAKEGITPFAEPFCAKPGKEPLSVRVRTALSKTVLGKLKRLISSRINAACRRS